MAKAKKFDLSNLKKLRAARKENQQQFWTRFGVTQSGGSRYESGRDIPKPTQKLMRLFFSGRIDDVLLSQL